MSKPSPTSPDVEVGPSRKVKLDQRHFDVVASARPVEGPPAMETVQEVLELMADRHGDGAPRPQWFATMVPLSFVTGRYVAFSTA